MELNGLPKQLDLSTKSFDFKVVFEDLETGIRETKILHKKRYEIILLKNIYLDHKKIKIVSCKRIEVCCKLEKT